jgi:hypothetical protein
MWWGLTWRHTAYLSGAVIAGRVGGHALTIARPYFVKRPKPESFRVYAISYDKQMGGRDIFKYGITKQANNDRLNAGRRSCEAMGFSGCGGSVIATAPNRYSARVKEFTHIARYYKQNGHCPIGQWRSCR